MTVPGIVYVIWWVLLLMTILIVLPVTVLLLQRTLNAARNIERYLAEMLEAGLGVAENTAHVRALEDTIAVATQMLHTAAQLRDHTEAIATVLGQRANGATGGRR